MKIFHVYILLCSDDSFYVGVTSNIERRMKQHESGFFPDAYTYSRRPVELMFAAEYSDPYIAFAWETRIKGWSRAKKIALINADWDLLQGLSECQNFTHYKFKE
jgi:putative endonuclease